MELASKPPVRWSAPEILIALQFSEWNGIFTPEADVFAFGMMVFEVSSDSTGGSSILEM